MFIAAWEVDKTLSGSRCLIASMSSTGSCLGVGMSLVLMALLTWASWATMKCTKFQFTMRQLASGTDEGQNQAVALFTHVYRMKALGKWYSLTQDKKDKEKSKGKKKGKDVGSKEAGHGWTMGWTLSTFAVAMASFRYLRALRL